MRTIEIRTAQNVTIEYETASLRERGLAVFIDLLIVFAFFFFVIFFLVLFLPALFGGVNSELFLVILYLVSPVTGFMLYQFASEALANGQSWGKKAMSIQVVRLDGKEPELTDYMLRAAFHLVDTILSSGVLAAIVIGSSAKGQRLGDLTANTTVIRTRNSSRFRLEDIPRIDSLDEYEPHYPQVRSLSEQDMLVVKSIVSRNQKYPNTAHRQAALKAAQHIAQLLDITELPRDPVAFLRTLLRDYIVLTR